ncbi:MAG: hypothetical protein AB7K67_15985 [Hyphomicrobiaceae bacterium]
MMLAVAGIATMSAMVWPIPARAAPLDDKTCEALRKQQAETASSEARRNMSRGAAWAKDNLPPDKIAQVLKLIELDEKVAFRCPIKQAAKPKPKAENGKPNGNGKAGAGKASAKPAAKRATAIQPKPVPQAKPRAKVNDAYVPPPKRSGQSNRSN